jgi:hypothetical protein
LFLIVAMIYKFHNGNANCKAFAITTIILLSIAIIGEICYIIYNGIWLTHSTVGDYMSKWFDVDLL